MDCELVTNNLEPIYELRAKAYRWLLPPEVTRLTDEYDATGLIYAVNVNGQCLGSVRISRNPMPFEQYYSVTPDPNSIEISKLAIDPDISCHERRAKVLKLLSSVWIKYARDNGIESIYAAAAQDCVAKFYQKLVGFKKVDTAIYKPATFNVALLKADVPSMLNMRMVQFIIG